MPDEIMNTMHEMAMPGSHHWFFWAVVVVVFALLLFCLWKFGICREKR